MLTLILLAVLGAGLGLLAVSLAERQPATVLGRNRRGEPGEPAEEPEIVFEVPDRTAADAADPTAASAQPLPPPEPPLPTPTPRRAVPRTPAGLQRVLRRPDGVRRSQAAVEGAFADVAVASLPRRVLALVGLVLVVVSVGVLVAVIVGAAVGAAVELFDQTFR